MFRLVRASFGKGRLSVKAIAILPQDGLIISILGGEKPHVGAVALGIPRPSLRDAQQLSATSSVMTVVGHKNDQVAKPLAEEMARQLGRVTAVVVGLHVENASPEDIQALLSNSQKTAGRLIAKLSQLATPDAPPV